LQKAVDTKDSALIVAVFTSGVEPDFLVQDEKSQSIPYYLKLLKENNFWAMDVLISTGYQIPQRHQKSTALIFAVSEKHEDMAEYLIKHGADVNDSNNYGWQAIHYAARSGLTDITKILIENDAEINKAVSTTDLGYVTPLMLAARNAYFETCVLLLEAGANIDYANSVSGTALDLAEKYKDFWVTSLLKAPDHIDDISLAYAIYTNNDALIQTLISKDIDPAYPLNYGWTSLHFAAQKGKNDVLKELLSKTNNMDVQKEDGFTPLMMAVYNNKFETVLLLLDNNASPLIKNADGQNVIDITKELNYKDIEMLFYDTEKAKAQYALNKSLWDACMKKRTDADEVKALLEKGAHPNAYNEEIYSALGIAVRKDDAPIVSLLLDHGADPNLWLGYQGKNRFTPLMVAAYNGYWESAKILIDKHADSSLKNGLGEGAREVALKQNQLYFIEFLDDYQLYYTFSFIEAVKNADLDVVKGLDPKDVRINYQDTLGNTALHYAVIEEEEEIFKLILEAYNADIHIKNKAGETALDFAIRANNAEAVFHLLKKKAEIPEFIGKMALREYISEPEYDIIRELIKNRASSRLSLDFQRAVEESDQEKMSLLIKKGVDVNTVFTSGYTALQSAIKESDIKMIEALIASGVNPNTKTSTDKMPLVLAVQSNNLYLFKLLLDNGADSTNAVYDGIVFYELAKKSEKNHILNYYEQGEKYYSYYLFHHNFWEAIAKGDKEAVERALAEGVKIEEYNAEGFNALHIAINNKQHKIAHLLIKKGADIEAKTQKWGRTPLILAAIAKDTVAVKRLLELGADTKVKDAIGFDFSLYTNFNADIAGVYIDFLTNKLQNLSNEGLFWFSRGDDPDDLEKLRDLVANGVDINQTDSNGWTPLHYAAESGSEEIVKYLIFQGANVDAKLESTGETALMIAAKNGQFEVCNFLMDYSDITLKNKEGKTAGEIASDHDQLLIVALFSDQKNTIKQYDFMSAAENENINKVKQYLEEGINPSLSLPGDDGWQALHFAAREGNLELIKILLNHNAEVNTFCETDGVQYTPLMLAVYNDDFLTAMQLVEQGANPDLSNESGESARSLAKDMELERHSLLFDDKDKAYNDYMQKQGLIDAVKNTDLTEFKQLIEKGYDVNQKDKFGWTALHYAARDNKTEFARMLLENDADPDIQKDDGYTAFMLAARNNQIPMLKLLIEYKADSALKDKNGKTAIDIAKENKAWEAVAYLTGNEKSLKTAEFHELVRESEMEAVQAYYFKNPFVLNEKDAWGFSALHYAARDGKLDISQWLISKGADVNAKADTGWTPLILAAINYQVEISYFLLKSKADPDIKDKEANTAYDYAINKGYLMLSDIYKNADSVYHHYMFLKNIDAYVIDKKNDKEEREAVYDALKYVNNINFKNDNQWNALFLATRRNNVELCKILIDKGIDLNTFAVLDNSVKGTALYIAAYNDYLEVFHLLKNNMDEHIYEKQYNQLKKIADDQNSLWIQYYLESPEETYRQYLFAVQMKDAIDKSNITAIQELIIDGADLSYPLDLKQTALVYAIYNSKNTVLDVLVKNTEDLDAFCIFNEGLYNALMLAAIKNNMEAAVKLFQAGADPELKNPKGEDARFLAEKFKSGDVLQFLNDPKQYAKNYALYEAIRSKDLILIRKSLTHGADINAMIKNKNLVFYAIDYLQDSVLYDFITLDFDKNVRDAKGRNIIYYYVYLASKKYTKDYVVSSYNMYHALIQKQIDPKIPDSSGATVLDFCKEEALFWYIDYMENPKAALNILREMEQMKEYFNQKDSLKALELFRQNPGLVKYTGSNKQSWLIFALQHALYSVAAYLIEQKSAFYTPSIYTSPFAKIVQLKGYDLLKLLISNDYDLDYSTHVSGRFSETPLAYVVNKGDHKAVEILLEAGANINLQSGWSNETPLILAVDDKDMKLTALLLNHGASADIPDKYNNYPLISVVKKNQKDLFELLLKYPCNVEVDDDGWTALHYAARDNKTEFLIPLLEKGAEINPIVNITGREYTPLMLAVYNENIEAIHALIAYGADPNFSNPQGETAISMARKSKSQNILKLFLEPEKAQLDYDLFMVVKSGDKEKTKDLIRKGADVNQVNKDRKGLLHIAIENKHPELVELLLASSKAHINLQDNEGNTALHGAIEKNDPVSVDLLLKAGAEHGLFNNKGENPLILAIERYEPGIIVRLLGEGADIKAENPSGIHALSYARRKGYTQIAEILENPGMITNIRFAKDIHKELIRDENTFDQALLEYFYDQINREFEPETKKYIFYMQDYVVASALYGNGIYAYNLSNELIRLTEKVHGKESDEYIYSLEINLLLCRIIGDEKKRLERSKELLEIVGRVHYYYSKEYYAQLLNLADVYNTNGMDSMAALSYEKVLKGVHAEDEKDVYLDVLKSFASFKLQQSDTAAYISMMEKLLDYFHKNSIEEEDHYNYINALLDFGSFYFEMGEDQKAFDFYREALLFVDTSNTVSDLQKESVYRSYATEIGKKEAFYNEAEQYFMKSREIIFNNNLDKGFLYSDHLYYYLSFLMDRGDHEKAYQSAKELNDLITSKLDFHFALLSEEEKYQYISTQRNSLDQIYSFGFNYKEEYPELTGMLYDNMLKIKGILLESSKTIFGTLSETNDKNARALYEQWKKAKNDLMRLYTQSAEDRNIDPGVLENKIENMEKEMIANSQLEAQAANNNISYKQIHENLGDNQAAIEIFHFDYKLKDASDPVYYCALVNTKARKYPSLVFLFEASELNDLIKKESRESNATYVSKLYSKRGLGLLVSTENVDYSEVLYEKLWQALEPYLDGIDEVFLSLSGLTHKIAYAAIPLDSNHTLIDKYNIRYVSSSRDVLKQSAREFSRQSVRLYGGIHYNIDSLENTNAGASYSQSKRSITYDSTRGGAWSYLQGTLDEVMNISAVFAKKGWKYDLFMGDEASEETFKNMDESPEILHFATHGFFFPEQESDKKATNPSAILFSESSEKGLEELIHTTENPLMRSGILMAGANYTWLSGRPPQNREDGILTAYEVSLMDLSNTELVVLSACETGLGDIRGSEGVFGLQRAFKLAGAQSMIMSLWQVPDQQTVELMNLFYAFLLDADTKQTAFRKAQLEMKKKYDPFYWAAFVLIE
jgi:ankyrin repeat protein/CHAT domain-containing protein